MRKGSNHAGVVFSTFINEKTFWRLYFRCPVSVVVWCVPWWVPIRGVFVACHLSSAYTLCVYQKTHHSVIVLV